MPPLPGIWRREVHRLVNEGADHQVVIDFMLSRYGDFVLYKPQMSGLNLVLWLGPVLLLLTGFAVLVGVVRKHRAANHPLAGETGRDGNGLTAEQQQTLQKVLGGEK